MSRNSQQVEKPGQSLNLQPDIAMGNLSDIQDSSSLDEQDFSDSDSRGEEHTIEVDAGDDDNSLTGNSFGVNAKSTVEDDDRNTQSLLQVGHTRGREERKSSRPVARGISPANSPANRDKRHKSMLVTKQGPKKGMRWLQEYSTVMLDKIQGRIISTARMSSLPKRPSVSSKLSKADSLPSNASDFMTRMTQHYDILCSVDSFDFDAFTVCEHIGRKDTFVMTVFRMM